MKFYGKSVCESHFVRYLRRKKHLKWYRKDSTSYSDLQWFTVIYSDLQWLTVIYSDLV